MSPSTVAIKMKSASSKSAYMTGPCRTPQRDASRLVHRGGKCSTRRNGKRVQRSRVLGVRPVMTDTPARAGAKPWEPLRSAPVLCCDETHSEVSMNGIIYLVGLVVVVIFILSFLGLR